MKTQRQKKLNVAIVSLFFLVASALNVQAEKIITLEEAYRATVIRSERIQIAREGVVQAREERQRARSALFPTLTGTFDYLRRPKAKTRNQFLLRSESESQLTVTLAQPLYSGGRAMSQYRIAQLGIRDEALSLALAKENLLLETARAYYEVLKATNNIRIEDKEVSRLEAHRRSAEKRLQVGEVTKTALLRADTDLSDAKAKLIRAKNEAHARKDELALLTGIELPFELRDAPSVAFSDRAELDWLALSHERRLDLQQKGVNIERASEGIKFARGNFLPFLSLDLEYRWVDQDPVGNFLIEEDPLAILRLTVPIFEGMLRTAELAQARSRLRQATLLRRQIQDEIDVAVRRAVLNLSTLNSELEHLKDRVRFAQEAYTLSSRQFEFGLGTHIDVLDANATLLDAERRYFNALYDREIAILQLKKETGNFTPLSKQPQSESTD